MFCTATVPSSMCTTHKLSAGLFCLTLARFISSVLLFCEADCNSTLTVLSASVIVGVFLADVLY